MSYNPKYVEDNRITGNNDNTPDRKDSSTSSIGKFFCFEFIPRYCTMLYYIVSITRFKRIP